MEVTSERIKTKVWGLTLTSVVMLVLSFPNFDYSILAWVAFVPALIAIARYPSPKRAFLLGWLSGAVFFYATCYWLTYSMIRYGGIPRWGAYLLLAPGPLVVGLFPGFFAALIARLFRAWGLKALAAVPFVWVSLEWARLSVTGQLWNAVGYSQAFHPNAIQTAKWGGVYAVGFLILSINAAVAFALLRRTARGLALSGTVICATLLLMFGASVYAKRNVPFDSDRDEAEVVALQPNVPMEFDKSPAEYQELLDQQLSDSARALNDSPDRESKRLVIWPESPMNFSYGSDPQLRERLANFTRANRTSLIINSQEVSPHNGFYNSALLINDNGELSTQYDKMRLMPFGEYVPLPQWLPGKDRISAMVGEFEAGAGYTVMRGPLPMGTFICIESAYPSIARNLTRAGAQVLVNISNDGYLGPTAVMRQHLGNAIFRAVENDRPLLRVTNTGITANISSRGEVIDATLGFQRTVRVWKVSAPQTPLTFYSKHGELFVGTCVVLSILLFAAEILRSSKPKTAR